MNVTTGINLPNSPKKLSVKLKNKLSNAKIKNCKPELRSSSLEGWSDW